MSSAAALYNYFREVVEGVQEVISGSRPTNTFAAVDDDMSCDDDDCDCLASYRRNEELHRQIDPHTSFVALDVVE